MTTLRQTTLGPGTILVIALVLVVTVGCHNPTAPESTTPAPSSAVIAGVTIAFEPNIYRNLQPTVGPPDTATVADLRLHANSSSFPTGVTVQSMVATLTATGERWSTSAITRSTLPGEPGYADFYAGHGPSWAVGASVDVRVTVAAPNGAVTVLEQQGVIDAVS